MLRAIRTRTVWLAVLATGLAASACGADGGVEGPALLGVDASQGGHDGSLDGAAAEDGGIKEVSVVGDAVGPGGDATASPDGSHPGDPADAKPAPDVLLPPTDTGPVSNTSCVGKCGQAKPKSWPCQCDGQCQKYGDCCDDFAQVCSDAPPVGPVCGDGKCQQPENNLNCDADCDQPPGAVQKCLYDKCKAQYDACFDNPKCVAAVACLNQGQSPQQCSAGDMMTAQVLGAMLQCGEKQGCLEDQPPPAACGNGQCEPGETATSCAADCKVPPPTTELGKCLAEQCAAPYAQCAKSAACLAAVECVGKTGKVQGCVKDQKTGQMLLPLAQCAWQQGCFEQDTDPPPAKCGDGVCTAPAESSQTCPADCGQPPAKACKSKADCAADQICCGKADGSQVCTAIGQCF